MGRLKNTATGLFVFASLLIGVAQAKQVEFTMVAEQEKFEVDANGKRRIKTVPAVKVKPGEEVIYTIFFKNVTEGALGNVVITDPIPADMRYLAGTAFGSGTSIQYSVDGNNFAARDGLNVRAADGQVRLARPSEYTHIRWTYENRLEPQQRGFVSFRAILK